MTFDLDKALAISCAIYRSKNNQYIQVDSFNHEENQYIFSNKTMLKAMMTQTHHDFQGMEYITYNNNDLELSKSIVKHFRKLSFAILAENISDFKQKIFLITQADKISKSDLGILACIPDVYFKDVKFSDQIKRIKNSSLNYVGEVGSKINVTCTIIETHYISNIQCYGHTAITSENNLISWLNKNQAGFENDTINISGKVKSHGHHYKTKVPETNLNYVKYH